MFKECLVPSNSNKILVNAGLIFLFNVEDFKDYDNIIYEKETQSRKLTTFKIIETARRMLIPYNSGSS